MGSGLTAIALASVLATVAPVRAAEPPYSIVTLGTSLTLRGGWPTPLAEAIATCLERPTTIQIVAAAGENSRWGLQHLGDVLAAEPDLVTIEFAINDASLVHGVSAKESAGNLAQIITTVRASRPDARIILVTTNPASGWGWASRFALDEFYAINPAVAASMGVDYIDLRPAWAARDTATEIPDGVHPLPKAAVAVFVPAIIANLQEAGLCGAV